MVSPSLSPDIAAKGHRQIGQMATPSRAGMGKRSYRRHRSRSRSRDGSGFPRCKQRTLASFFRVPHLWRSGLHAVFDEPAISLAAIDPLRVLRCQLGGTSLRNLFGPLVSKRGKHPNSSGDPGATHLEVGRTKDRLDCAPLGNSSFASVKYENGDANYCVGSVAVELARP